LRCRFVRLFSKQGTHGKKFIPAGFAAQRGEPQNSPDDCGRTRHILGRDVLQFVVAANPAMSVEEASERHRASMKAYFAGDAAPRKNAHETEKMVLERPALGPAAFRGLTNRAA